MRICITYIMRLPLTENRCHENIMRIGLTERQLCKYHYISFGVIFIFRSCPHCLQVHRPSASTLARVVIC